MPRFVVQQHFRSNDDYHFDFMLEAGEMLVTFSCGAAPDEVKNLPCLVRQIQDHRVEFLSYQGDISGGRGWCEIHDRGTFEWIEPETLTDAAAASLLDQFVVRLDGRKACGTYRLTRETASGADYWRMSTATTD